MRIIGPEDALALIAMASADPHAAVCDSLQKIIETIGAADPPALCSLCGRELKGGPAAYVLVSRYVDMPKEATGGALCHACIEPGEPVLDRLVENFQRTIMRDLRVLPTPGPPGSA